MPPTYVPNVLPSVGVVNPESSYNTNSLDVASPTHFSKPLSCVVPCNPVKRILLPFIKLCAAVVLIVTSFVPPSTVNVVTVPVYTAPYSITCSVLEPYVNIIPPV